MGTGSLPCLFVRTLLQTEKEEGVNKRNTRFSSGRSHFFLGPDLIFSCSQNYIIGLHIVSLYSYIGSRGLDLDFRNCNISFLHLCRYTYSYNRHTHTYRRDTLVCRATSSHAGIYKGGMESLRLHVRGAHLQLHFHVLAKHI